MTGKEITDRLKEIEENVKKTKVKIEGLQRYCENIYTLVTLIEDHFGLVRQGKENTDGTISVRYTKRANSAIVQEPFFRGRG